MKKIAIAGNIILDIIKMIDYWPEKGMLSNIIEQECAVGGCVSNTAIDLKVLDPDIQVKCYGVIGNDDYGTYVKKVLESYNLDIEQIVITNNSTSYTDVMTVSSGERTFFHNKGCYKNFTIDDINLDSLDCELFHLGYLLLLDRFDEYDCLVRNYQTQFLILIIEPYQRVLIDRFCSVLVPDMTIKAKPHDSQRVYGSCEKIHEGDAGYFEVCTSTM